MKMKNHTIAVLLLIANCSSFAQETTTIPPNLLYQTPSSIAKTQLAELTGSRPISDALLEKSLRFKLGNIYISYIDSKATLSYFKDWEKSFQLTQGRHDIRFVADFQMGIFKGTLSFEAMPQQSYQILSERDKSVKGLQYLFWVANRTTGEIVSDKIALTAIGASSSVNYMPVIRSN